MDFDKILKDSLLHVDRILSKFDYDIMIKMIIRLGYSCSDRVGLEKYLRANLMLDFMVSPGLMRAPVSRVVMFIFAAGFAKHYSRTRDLVYSELAKFYMAKFNQLKDPANEELDKLNKLLVDVGEFGAVRKNISYFDLSNLIGKNKEIIFDSFYNKL